MSMVISDGPRADDGGGRAEVVYGPESKLRDPVRLARSMIRDLAASRELAWRLCLRNLSARYRQSAMGYVWAVLPRW